MHRHSGPRRRLGGALMAHGGRSLRGQNRQRTGCTGGIQTMARPTAHKCRYRSVHEIRHYARMTEATGTGASEPDSNRDARFRPENFWTLATTAMTRQEAEDAALLISERFEQVHAFAVDPRSSLTLGLDRFTAEMMREALVRLASAGGDIGNMLYDFDEFLAHARPYGDGEEHWEPPARSS
jgi:hypothetical protein